MNKLWQLLKEELIALPVLAVLLIFVKQYLHFEFPDSAQFDMPSEIETIVFAMVKLLIFTSMSWLVLRIVFPGIFKYFREELYHNFKAVEEKEKRRISILVFFIFLLSLILLSSCNSAYASEALLRKSLVTQLNTQLQVREKTGNNDGKEVEIYLASVGQKKGAPWCAAFCSYNLKLFRVPNPQSAWSPNFALAKDIVWSPKLLKQKKVIQDPQPGDCFTLYFQNLKRVGHVGFIVGEDDKYFITIEGNTNGAGSRDGDGVYKKKRDKHKVFAVTNYITPYSKSNEKATISGSPVNYVYRLPKHKKYHAATYVDHEGYIYFLTDGKTPGYDHNSTGRLVACTPGTDPGYSDLSAQGPYQYAVIYQWRQFKCGLLERFITVKAAIVRLINPAGPYTVQRCQHGQSYTGKIYTTLC